MSGIRSTAEDDLARGLGLAAHSVMVELLRTLVKTNALITPDLRALLSDAEAKFLHSNPSEPEMAARASIEMIRDAILPKP